MSSPLNNVELQATLVACPRLQGNPAVPNSTIIPSHRHNKVPTDTSIPTIPSVQPSLTSTRSTPRPKIVPFQESHFCSKQVLESKDTASRSSQYRTGSLSDTTSLPTSSLLSLPRRRPNRQIWENPTDPQPTTSFGDSVIQKSSQSIRIFFQNVHGLSHSTGLEDYKYYFQSPKAYHIDIMVWQKQTLAGIICISNPNSNRSYGEFTR